MWANIRPIASAVRPGMIPVAEKPVMSDQCTGSLSYFEMIDMFGVERKLHRIERFEMLPFTERKFDLITAFQIFLIFTILIRCGERTNGISS